MHASAVPKHSLHELAQSNTINNELIMQEEILLSHELIEFANLFSGHEVIQAPSLSKKPTSHIEQAPTSQVEQFVGHSSQIDSRFTKYLGWHVVHAVSSLQSSQLTPQALHFLLLSSLK